jgi:hypothetical protein
MRDVFDELSTQPVEINFFWIEVAQQLNVGGFSHGSFFGVGEVLSMTANPSRTSETYVVPKWRISKNSSVSTPSMYHEYFCPAACRFVRSQSQRSFASERNPHHLILLRIGDDECLSLTGQENTVFSGGSRVTEYPGVGRGFCMQDASLCSERGSF